jgi:hypothetical protein
MGGVESIPLGNHSVGAEPTEFNELSQGAVSIRRYAKPRIASIESRFLYMIGGFPDERI